MTTKVEKTVLVNVPLSVAYNQWTQFEEFPQFMGGITSVTQLSDDRLQWVAEIAGIRRQWEARVVEQVPDRRVAWAATEGATNAGSVSFEDVGGGQTSVHLSLEYEPEGLVENVGDKLGVIENRAESDLDRFKAFIESEGYASGAWRGAVVGERTAGSTPGVDDADQTRGDSGKAGVSGKAVAAGLGVAAAAATAVGLAAAGRSDDKGDTPVPTAPTPTPTPATAVPTPVTETPAAPVADRPVGGSAGVEPGHVLTSDEIDASVEDSEGNTRHDA
ncbi:Polyketide cyclase / dehydrase and lipid transport [Friedmanniella luteola]|uniref:Polyketide cyclase / dehydrase and lipid transport n=1 Tax=Friedmanniella luteola TaxID=546871 RepID=A0A1H1TL18_9ACTN|nr:SRPBCC family protein [Friedmanniella luteola]SDS60920.1 Polyketide cyclase / dehydrase and lipid transport [Friedmanniella luteola]